MSDFFTFIAIALLIYFVIRSYKSTTPNSNQTISANNTKLGETKHMKNSDDIFLDNLADRINEINNAAQAAKLNREKELKDKYSCDLEMQRKLIDFAKQYKLGEALIYIWEEIRYYPSWTKKNDFKKKINISDIEISEENGIKKVFFSFNSISYAIDYSSRRSYLPDDDSNHATFTLYENNQNVFGISAEEDYQYDYLSYGTPYIERLIKKGNWITFLIEGAGEIKIAKAKQDVEFKYYSADKIKTNFKE